MTGARRRALASWPRLFFYTFLLVLLRPEDPLPYLFFLPGIFFSSAFRGETRPLYLWLGWSFFSALWAPGFPASLATWGEECLVGGAGFAAGLYGRQDRRW
ncbi:MAG: hypothetical protein GX202_00775, partial [Firmicutes bacterium]|nr:hypothetical protein [Bacillota bacterium]